MLIRGYARNIYKNKIEFASVNRVNSGDRGALVVPTRLIESLTILDETVKYFDDIARHVNKIGKFCEIDVDTEFARRVCLNGV
jgi:hypothetical protein